MQEPRRRNRRRECPQRGHTTSARAPIPAAGAPRPGRHITWETVQRIIDVPPAIRSMPPWPLPHHQIWGMYAPLEAHTYTSQGAPTSCALIAERHDQETC